METMDYRTGEEKWNDFKANLGRKAKDCQRNVNNTIGWLADHPGALVVLVPAAVTVWKTGTVTVNKLVEAYHRDRQVWDPVLGHYFDLKRKLSGQEWVIIEARKKAGESIGQILSDMGVLK